MSANADDTLNTLTDEERAAIAGDDGDASDLEALRRIAGATADPDKAQGNDDDEDDGADDDDGDDDGDDPNEAAAAAADTTAAGARESAADGEPPTEGRPASVSASDLPDPIFEARLPSDYDEQIKGLKDQEAALRQRYRDGEIDIDERDTALSALVEQREALLVARVEASVAEKMRAQQLNAQIKSSLESIMARSRDDGVDYKDQKNSTAFDRYTAFLVGDPDWAGKSIAEIHAEAHRYVMGRLGKTAPAPAPSPRESLKDAANKRRPPVDAAPKTLAQVPGGDGPGDVGSEFADIEALDGMEYEAAIAKMTPAQRDRFLRG